MKKNKLIIPLLAGTALIILALVLNSLGVIDLRGTAGIQSGDLTPTPSETSVPSDTTTILAPSKLTLELGEQSFTCNQVAAIIIMGNPPQSQTASNISVEIKVIDGTNYISQSPTAVWRVGSLVGGQKKLVNFRINTNESWQTAPTDDQIVLEVVIEAETSNALENVGKRLQVSFSPSSACQPTPTPAPEKNETCKNWYMFHSLRTGDLDIYRLDGIEGQPGIRLYNLSNSPANDQNPSRSPDGMWVVFETDRDKNFEIYLVDAAGGNLRRLTDADGADINPMFGPDNRTIVFQSNRNGNWDLYLYDRIARQETQLTNDENDETNPYWSPNGQSIVYQTNRAGNWDLIILDLQSGEETVLAAQNADEILPAFAPDGSKIGYLFSTAEGTQDLYFAQVANLGVTKVTNGRAVANLAWSPDSRSLAFEDTRENNTDIYLYRLTTNAEIRLTENAGVDRAPTWDCKGVNVYYTSQIDKGEDIFQIPFTGGQTVRMTVDPGQDFWPVFNNPRLFGSSLP